MGMAAFFTSVTAAQVEHFRGHPDELIAFLYPEDGDEPPNSADVDKAWHGLHYLFAGTSYGGEGALAQAVLVGEPIGEEMDFGPARHLAPAQVAAIAAALNALGLEELKARYRPEDMEAQQIYPDSIWVSEGDEAFDYLLGYFETLKAYYADAAARGDAVITWIA